MDLLAVAFKFVPLKYQTHFFGGIWINDKQEFAKFASAVNNYAFEEDGEGIAYTDNYFYAYYINVDGQVIPFASANLDAEESQDIVNQVNQEIKDGRKEKGIKSYIDRAVARARNAKGKGNAYNGNHSSSSGRRGYDRLGSIISRKGKYYDRPDLFVKAKRVDRFGLTDNIRARVESTRSNSCENIQGGATRLFFILYIKTTPSQPKLTRGSLWINLQYLLRILPIIAQNIPNCCQI